MSWKASQGQCVILQNRRPITQKETKSRKSRNWCSTAQTHTACVQLHTGRQFYAWLFVWLCMSVCRVSGKGNQRPLKNEWYAILGKVYTVINIYTARKRKRWRSHRCVVWMWVWADDWALYQSSAWPHGSPTNTKKHCQWRPRCPFFC